MAFKNSLVYVVSKSFWCLCEIIQECVYVGRNQWMIHRDALWCKNRLNKAALTTQFVVV